MCIRVATLSLLAALAAPASAQILFDTPAVASGGQWPIHLLVGDVNEDGFPDIITQHFVFGGLATVTYGTAIGQFGGSQPVPGLTINDRPARLADFDQDGHLDLLCFAGQSKVTSVSVLRGHGDGTYDPPHGINGDFEAPIDSALGDFNADGFLDVAIYNGAFGFWGGSILAVLGHGDGSFAEPVNCTPSSFPFGTTGLIRVGDTNGDGFDDIVLTTDISMPTLLSNGNGSFSQVPCTSGCGSTIDKDFELADVNADGRDDLVACTLVLLARTDGTFNLTGQSLPFDSAPRTVEVADLDADGALDIAVGRNGTGSEFDPESPAGDVRVYRGNGNGSFQLPGLIVSQVPQPRDLLIADIDLDGRPDVVVAELQDAPVSARVLFNRTYEAGSPFLDLGGALAGSNGYPIQLASGTLVAGQPFSFQVKNGPASGAAYHVVGLSRIDAPFKSGVVIPALNLVNGPFPLSAAGNLNLAGNWPAGGSGLTLYAQFWMPNGGGPVGLVSSSGVRAQVP